MELADDELFRERVNAKVIPEPINNTKLVEDFRAAGGRILHINPTKRPGRKGRCMTIAFVPHNGRVEVATSITHRNDCFTKKIGTKLAIEHFQAGKTVFLPINVKGCTQALAETFYWMV